MTNDQDRTELLIASATATSVYMGYNRSGVQQTSVSKSRLIKKWALLNKWQKEYIRKGTQGEECGHWHLQSDKIWITPNMTKVDRQRDNVNLDCAWNCTTSRSKIQVSNWWKMAKWHAGRGSLPPHEIRWPECSCTRSILCPESE